MKKLAISSQLMLRWKKLLATLQPVYQFLQFLSKTYEHNQYHFFDANNKFIKAKTDLELKQDTSEKRARLLQRSYYLVSQLKTAGTALCLKQQKYFKAPKILL